MKPLLSFSVLIIAISAACSSPNSKPTITSARPKVCQTVKANTVQEMGVKGMVCQMGCGGSIRKSLKETCAVERVEVNYIDTLDEQIIKVFYDRKQIGPKQMVQLLTELNDKQFSVRTLGSPTKI